MTRPHAEDNPTESGTPAAVGLADAALLSVAVIWGINIPLMKIGLGFLDMYVFNALRLCVSAGVLAGLAIRERRRGHGLRGPVRLRELLAYSAVVSGCYQLLFLAGVKRTTSGNTALIMSTVPLWTGLLASLFLHERLRRLAWGGLLTALVGTIIVALQKGDVSVGTDHLKGNAIILVAALMWSAGTVYSRNLLHRITPLQLAAVSAALALPAHLLFAAGRYQESLPALASVPLWLIIVYSGTLSTGLALPLWSYGVRNAGAAHAAIVQNLVPVVAIAAAWVSRGETVVLPQVIGGSLILVGLVLMRLARGH